MSVEVTALKVGDAIAKLVARRWLAARAAKAAASTELVELMSTGFRDEILRRKSTNQFDSLASSIAERLRPYLRREFADLDEGAREAAVHQVILTLNEADLSDKALLSDDMDPVRLARRLRGTLPAREAEFQLGQAGSGLYEVVLDECCDCLAHALIHLPEFSERAAAESLSRLTTAVGLLQALLARLPVRTLSAPEGDSLDDDFTRRYLAFISENLDRIELFGVRFERFTRPQTTLSVAYISLNVTEDTPRKLNQADQNAAPVTERHEAGAVPVEHALGERRLMLIRGEAGGGKSTLLRWLAISAARGGFTDELASLNGFVPFLIKLRSHAGHPLPRPEEFLDDAAGSLSGLMPRGWAHRRLLSGRALLLVDGIDEITESQRQAVPEWLRGIIAEFPGVRAVVTSRPAAAAAGWLQAEGFGTAFLEQLHPADLRTLIRHWHQAVRHSDSLPCLPQRLPSYEARLLARLESAPHLRTLASTPLLAAMLCALNLDRESLPRDRMGLHAAAIDMLVETRDAKRSVPSAQVTPLEREQKIRILRDLAWHLSTSGRVELPKATAEKLIADRLHAMPQVRACASAVLDTLLQRSGVLREPVPGKIDFVHRTVQEYLAAAHAADLGDMDYLIRNAHLDQWRETVIMAAGHANDPLRRELITGILRRARSEAERRNARRLELLAVACLETMPSIPDDLRTALDLCLDDLIPPVDPNEAQSLAGAGEPVLQRLPETLNGLPRAAALMIVRTARLINGPGALDVLRRYASAPSHDIGYELGRAWEFFDSDEYAERVLGAMPEGGCLRVWYSPARAAALSIVPPLRDLRVDHEYRPAHLAFLAPHAPSLGHLALLYKEPGADLTTLPDLPRLQSLAFSIPKLGDLAFLDSLPSLQSVWFTHCGMIGDYSPLQRSTSLKDLWLIGCRRLHSLEQLPPLRNLESLWLVGSRLAPGSLEYLARSVPDARQLGLRDCDWLDNLAPLRGHASLALLDVSQTVISDLRPLEDLTQLTELRLTGCSAISDLRPLGTLPHLSTLYIEGIAPGTDLSPLARNKRVIVHVEARQDIRGGDKLESRLRAG